MSARGARKVIPNELDIAVRRENIHTSGGLKIRANNRSPLNSGSSTVGKISTAPCALPYRVYGEFMGTILCQPGQISGAGRSVTCTLLIAAALALSRLSISNRLSHRVGNSSAAPEQERACFAA